MALDAMLKAEVTPDSSGVAVFASDSRSECPGARDALNLRTRQYPLFVALQACVSLATHWPSGHGMDVPHTYADVLAALNARR